MSVDNFTASLIEMAEAVKAKPELEAQIASLKAELEVTHNSLNIAHMKAAHLETELAKAKAKREEAMRDRDEASFRNLELEEKLDQFASMAGKVLGMVKPQAAPTPEPQANPTSSSDGHYPTEATSTEPAEYDWRNDPAAASAEPVTVPAWDKATEAPYANTKPGVFHEYPYSWKPSSMSDEDWAFGGGRPGNPPATGTDPLS